MPQRSPGIIFSPNVFNSDGIVEGPLKQCQTSSNSSTMAQDQRHEVVQPILSESGVAETRPSKPGATTHSNRHVIFQDPHPQRRMSSVHPAFRRRPASGRAGDILTLDDRIVRNGGTTSTYEQLPHRLRISKQNRPVSATERVVELTRTNGYLLQELAYHKDSRAADLKFYERVLDLQARLEDALKERSKRQADAESTLLNYWGIHFGDGNIEDTVF